MMTDPVFDYARPDVEALVWATVGPLGGVTSWAYTANDVRTPAGWLSQVSVQVDVRARSKQAAYARADAARRLLMGLPGQAWPGGVVNRVDTVEGPFWLADPTGAPRYVARYDLYVHPLPVAAVPA
jgi:hypothetical protein